MTPTRPLRVAAAARRAGRVDHLDHRDLVALPRIAKHRRAGAVARDHEQLTPCDTKSSITSSAYARAPRRSVWVRTDGAACPRRRPRFVRQLVEHRTSDGQPPTPLSKMPMGASAMDRQGRCSGLADLATGRSLRWSHSVRVACPYLRHCERRRVGVAMQHRAADRDARRRTGPSHCTGSRRPAEIDVGCRNACGAPGCISLDPDIATASPHSVVELQGDVDRTRVVSRMLPADLTASRRSVGRTCRRSNAPGPASPLRRAHRRAGRGRGPFHLPCVDQSLTHTEANAIGWPLCRTTTAGFDPTNTVSMVGALPRPGRLDAGRGTGIAVTVPGRPCRAGEHRASRPGLPITFPPKPSWPATRCGRWLVLAKTISRQAPTPSTCSNSSSSAESRDA